MMTQRILVPVAPGFEELELVAPVDILRRAGAEVVLVSLDGKREVVGRSGITIVVEGWIAEKGVEGFEMLMIPGGPGVKVLREDGRPALLAKSFVEDGKLVAAICAAPLVLADAGLLVGRKFTAHYSTVEELPQALTEEKVVEDDLLITSRGAGTAIDFGLGLVTRLFGVEKANEIARSIMSDNWEVRP